MPDVGETSLVGKLSEEDKGFAGKAHDLQAMRDAVVDAAGVSAGLWLTYLSVLAYLLIAAAGVTHKDLLLESPIKLPFVDVPLPLRGFFCLGPIIFLVIHTYVLLHFGMLSDRVRAFDRELRKQIDLCDGGPGSCENESDTCQRLRRQLPINIFVQFLAGPPEMRGQFRGILLKLIALISLVIAPVALLVFFQVWFLPYHSEGITWCQRIAVLLDLALLWLLWRGVAVRATRSAWRRWAKYAVAGFGTLVPLVFVFIIATFPGEWRDSDDPDDMGDINPSTLEPFITDRLVLIGVDVIDHGKLDSDEKITALHVSASLRDRNLRNAVLIGADLRKVDFTAANLQGARLDGAQLQDAQLVGAKLQGASLVGADLRGVLAWEAQLQGASFACVQAPQVLLWVHCSQLQGARLNGAQLQGASLDHAQLQAARLDGAQLQGASLDGAQLQGASLDGAQLQGASLDGSKLQGASLSGVFAWRASLTEETAAQGASVDQVILEPKQCAAKDESCPWSPQAWNDFRKDIEQQVVPGGKRGKDALERLDRRLDPSKPWQDEQKMSERWHALESVSANEKAHKKEIAEQWRKIGCATDGAPYVLATLSERIDTFEKPERQYLAKAFLDSAACAGARGMSPKTRTRLGASSLGD